MATTKSDETTFCKEYFIRQEHNTIMETWFSPLMSTTKQDC